MKNFLIFVLGVLFGVATVQAYPEFIAKGYTTCASCHYSPTGGGLPNSYGHAATEATFPDTFKSKFIENLRETLKKNDVTGYDKKRESQFQWDVGLDARLLFIDTPQVQNGNSELAVIPMLIEVGGVLAYGPWLFYGTLTPRRASSDRTPDTAFSREHWIDYRWDDHSHLRAGRMVLPFGLRVPDHTAYTREDLGFNKWDQSYALEYDYISDHWTFSSAGFFGDFILDPPEVQQRGGVVTATYNVVSRASLGASFLGSTGDLWSNIEGSLFLRARFIQRFYGMGEWSPYYRWGSTANDSATGAASLVRLGWFPIESLDLYFEWGGRGIFNERELTKYRYLWGTNWQILPWLELAPTFQLEETVETGLEFTAYGQLHVIY